VKRHGVFASADSRRQELRPFELIEIPSKKVRQQGKREGKTLLPQECGSSVAVSACPFCLGKTVFSVRPGRSGGTLHILYVFSGEKSSPPGKKARKKTGYCL
jgi:hypothetical protein